GDDLDLHHIADFANTVNAVDILVVQLADVTETVAARQDLDKGPEVLDAGHPAFVDFSDADFLGQGLDFKLSGFRAGGVQVRNKHSAVVINVDLGARGFLNAFDGLAARPN